MTSRLLLGGGPRKSETTRLPGSPRSSGIRLIGKVLIKDDTLGRQAIQIRRLHPLIAVAADIAEDAGARSITAITAVATPEAAIAIAAIAA